MSGEKLLLVDDEDNLRSMLEAALRHHGFDVELATTGRSALEQAAATAPDLIVLGRDVARPGRLRGLPPPPRAEGDHTPVLFLTARDTTEDKVRGLTLGGDDYLVKPFSLEELVARCQALLRRAGLVRADDVGAALRRPRDATTTPTGCSGPEPRWPCHPPSTTSCATCCSTRTGPVQGPDPGPRVAVRLRRRRRRGGDLHRLPAPQARHTDPKLIHTVRGVGYSLREP